MKTIFNLIGLLCLSLSALAQTQQTFNVDQIRPSTVNNYVLTTIGGSTVWAPDSGGGPVVEVNGTPLITPSPVNFLNSASVSFTNPSAGVIQATAVVGFNTLVVPPVPGQFVILYPTSGTITADNGTALGTSLIDAHSALLFYSCNGTLCVPGTTSALWSGFSLPSFVNPANVTAVYGFSVSSATALGQMPNPQIRCGASIPVSPSTTFGWTMQQGTALLSGLTGSGIASATCDSSQSGSLSGLKQSIMNVSAVGLIVYYTGTPPPVDNTISVVPPLFYNTSSHSLGIGVNLLSIPFSVTTTAATSDVITVNGMTPTGHCVLFPTNSTAGTMIQDPSPTFISAKNTNLITLTHVATAGATFDGQCTAQ